MDNFVSIPDTKWEWEYCRSSVLHLLHAKCIYCSLGKPKLPTRRHGSQHLFPFCFCCIISDDCCAQHSTAQHSVDPEIYFILMEIQHLEMHSSSSRAPISSHNAALPQSLPLCIAQSARTPTHSTWIYMENNGYGGCHLAYKGAAMAEIWYWSDNGK